MSEMSFEQMLEESLKTIRNGEVVEGTVIDVKPDEIVLNIGYKADGIITRNEYTNESNVVTIVNSGTHPCASHNSFCILWMFSCVKASIKLRFAGSILWQI